MIMNLVNICTVMKMRFFSSILQAAEIDIEVLCCLTYMFRFVVSAGVVDSYISNPTLFQVSVYPSNDIFKWSVWIPLPSHHC